MRKIFYLLLSAALVLSVDALGDTLTATSADAKAKRTKKCVFPKSLKRAPDWVCNAHADGLAVAAVGSAAKSDAGISFMEQMAAADARTRLARSVREPRQKKIAGSKGSANKNTAERDGALTTSITNESLQSTKILKSAYGPDGTLYVLVGLDEASVHR